MALKSIGSVVNASFIQSFEGLAGSGTNTPLKKTDAATQLYNGLRLGARTYATALQNLNAGISVVNIASSDLKKLGTLIDKMEVFAERSTHTTIGSDERKNLQFQLQDLAKNFRDIVNSASLGGNDYLTESGLATLFARIGLNKDDSQSVASIFKQFLTSTGHDTASTTTLANSSAAISDDFLASETEKGPRPVDVPAVQGGKTQRITNGVSGTGGGISSKYSIYSSSSTPGNSGVIIPNFKNAQGVLTSEGPSNSGVENQTALAINPRSGIAAITSTGHLTGDLASGAANVFLVDPSGTILRQVSNNADGSPAVPDLVALSQDSKTVAVVTNSTGAGNDSLQVNSVANLTDPPGASTTTISVAGTNITSVALSADGTHVAYKDAGAGNPGITIKTAGGIDATLAAVNISSYAFVSSSSLVYVDNSGNLNLYKSTLDGGDGTSTALTSGASITHLTALENDSTLSSNTTSSVAFTYGANNVLAVAKIDPSTQVITTRYTKTLGAGSIDNLTMAYQDDGSLSKDRIDVGIEGALTQISGNPSTQLYRVSETATATLPGLKSSTPETQYILDGSLTTRSDAYRMLSDLKAMRSQIDNNIKALNSASQMISDNMDLIRVAGFAFLDVSNQITSKDTAETVAAQVASQIRANGKVAQLAQAENLSNITAVTVSLLNSSSGG